MLAACGGSQLPIGAPGAVSQGRTIATHAVRSGSLQDTSSVPDGFSPSSRLVGLSGELYGTTSIGGANNLGTAYSITTSGVENVVYSFAPGCQKRKKCSDGLNPTGLIAHNGTLYGTTGGGGVGPCENYYGPNGCGTVFSITASGVETVLYSFTGGGCTHHRRCPDANYPNGLTAIEQTLYGTSWYGGKYGLGTAYSVTTSGVEKVLHSFGRGCFCGYPNAGLIYVDGTLYGTTLYGGAQNAGSVFSMRKTGSTYVLYSFDAPPGGGSAGANGSLIDVKGLLYGTTYAGGAYQRGTAFSITTNGVPNVLHSFGSGPDGEHPYSGLIDVHGILYGTTAAGGTGASGTVFRLTTSGKEKVLYSFGSSKYDGSTPAESLTELSGTLYGTTLHGGRCDGGTVFSITMSGREQVLHSFC